MNDYITIDEITLCGNQDEYGYFTEYSVFACPEIKQLAHEQFADIYIPSEDSYMDYYARRYEDGSVRMWVGIHEDFTTSGVFEDGELMLPDYIYEALGAERKLKYYD